MFQDVTIQVSWVDGLVDVDINMKSIIKLEKEFGSLTEFAAGMSAVPKMSHVASFYSNLLALGGKVVPVEDVYSLLFSDQNTMTGVIENVMVALNCMFPAQEETGAPKGVTTKKAKSRKTTGKKSIA